MDRFGKDFNTLVEAVGEPLNELDNMDLFVAVRGAPSQMGELDALAAKFKGYSIGTDDAPGGKLDYGFEFPNPTLARMFRQAAEAKGYVSIWEAADKLKGMTR